MSTSFSPLCRLSVVSVGLALLLASGFVAQAQSPVPPSLPDARLRWILPAGGQQGTTFDVTVGGLDLDGGEQLRFDHPGITGVPKLAEPGLGQTGAQPVPNVFCVTINAEVKPGIYDVRVAGKYGLSGPRAFVVGSQSEMNEITPNNSLQQACVVPLGTTVNGVAKDTETDYFKFTGKRGQRIIIDSWGFRIDSNIDPVLVLYDSAGRELLRDQNTNRRDALLDFTVPEDGDYIVSLHDLQYNYWVLTGECYYRLSISTGPYLDFIFPPAGLPGSQGQYTLYGRNLPGGQPAQDAVAGGWPLEKLSVNIALPAEKSQHLGGDMLVDASEAFIDGIEYRLDSPQGLSNPLLISMAGAPVVPEQEPNDDPAQAPLLKLPCEVVGQFYPRDDQDWVAFEAKKGDVYWIEVFSQRLGLPTDPYLLVQQMKKDEQGAPQAVDLIGVDDVAEVANFVHWSMLGGLLFNTATHDPAYRFEAPDTGTYRVMVQDLARASKASPRYVYRLSIRPPQPDFRLVAVPRPPTVVNPEQGQLNNYQSTSWSPLLRKGGAELIEIFAIRRDGFEGEIHVSAGNLPPGVTAAPVVLSAVTRSMAEPIKRSATLVLKAADDAPPSMTPITVTGKSMLGQTEVVRQARTGAMVWPGVGVLQPRSRLTRQLVVAVGAPEPAPFSLEVPPNLALEASVAGTVKFAVNLVRRGDFKGSVAVGAYGLPLTPNNQVHAQPTFYPARPEIKADQTTTEFEMKVPLGIPAGTYSIFLSGIGTVSYARNPEASKAALDRKVAVEKIVADDAVAAKAAVDAQAAAEKTRTDSVAAQLKAAEELKAADKAIADAQALATLAAAKAAEAQVALAADAGNAALVAAKQAADKAALDTKTAVKVATDARTTVEKTATAVADQLKLTTDAKAAADKAVAESDAKARQSAAFLATFIPEVTKLQDAAKPIDLKISAPSPTITLKITSVPFALDPVPVGIQLKQGTNFEFPVTIKRLYGFADPVQLSLSLPPDLLGVSVPTAAIPAGANQVALSFIVAGTASPGIHVGRLGASVTYGGQALTVYQEIPVTIEKVDPPK